MLDLDTIGYFLFMEEQESKQKEQQDIFVVENKNDISTREEAPNSTISK